MCADLPAYQLLSPREEAERNKTLHTAHAVEDWVQWLWPLQVPWAQPEVRNGEAQAINMLTEHGLAHVFAPPPCLPHVSLMCLSQGFAC